MLQPANTATPEATVTPVLVQVSAASAGDDGWVIVKVTVPALVVVTVLPPRSCTATWGCVPKTTPLAAPLGEVVKPSCAAVPTVVVTGSLVAVVNAPSTAFNV